MVNKTIAVHSLSENFALLAASSSENLHRFHAQIGTFGVILALICLDIVGL
jgi:hypothetical protein